jgi:hypothetical protein
MNDAVSLVLIILFFLAGLGLVILCQRLMK